MWMWILTMIMINNEKPDIEELLYSNGDVNSDLKDCKKCEH